MIPTTRSSASPSLCTVCLAHTVSCAGIDCDGISNNELVYAIKSRLPFNTSWSGPTTGWLVEWNKDCQKELQLLHGPVTTCLFDNMLDFLDPAILGCMLLFMERPELAWQGCLGLVQSGKAVRTRAWCRAHGKLCCVTTCDSHSFGTPCVGFSQNNNDRPGITDPKSGLVLVLWCGMRAKLQEAKVGFENVFPTTTKEKRPPDYIKEALFHIYFVDLAQDDSADIWFSDPVNLGAPSSHEREYVSMRHRY